MKGSLFCITALLGAAACGGDSKPTVSAAMVEPVLDNYATNLHQMYTDAVADNMSFSATVETFLAAPSQANLDAARVAWLASRAHYMLTEGARFYGGPIDAAPPASGGYEAELNSWPLDGNYIDYTTNPQTMAIDDTTGIVNNPSMLQTISASGIDTLNATAGDDDISDGYHAVEYLLWGQALQPIGPGSRPYTDYLSTGPRPNVDRRTAYLRAAIAGITEHLQAVAAEWAPGAAYRTTFTSGGLTSVGLAFTGMGRFSKGELAGQRVNAPYTSKSRGDQHDCFSSDTLTDYIRDVEGIVDLYQGDYGTNNGAGFDELVAVVDPALNTKLLAQVATSVTDMKAIPGPFEAAIMGADSDPGRTAILAVVNSLRAQGDQFAQASAALGQKIVVPEDNE